jgi:hypothetical protein
VANLRSRPPRLDPDDFIAGAEAPMRPGMSSVVEHASIGSVSDTPQEPRKDRGESKNRGQGRAAQRSWEAPGVRPDVTKAFNLRLPEPLKLKLDFIRQRTLVSTHEFIMNAVVPAVEAEIERLERERA